MFVITLPVTVNLVNPHIHAETAEDPAPQIEHEGDFKGKVLFDNTHGQTAGAADWVIDGAFSDFGEGVAEQGYEDRKSTRLNSSHVSISYAVFCLKKKKHREVNRITHE